MSEQNPQLVDSKHRVALELMKYISSVEDSKEKDSKPREYYLKLYEQSLSIVKGASTKSIIGQ